MAEIRKPKITITVFIEPNVIRLQGMAIKHEKFSKIVATLGRSIPAGAVL